MELELRQRNNPFWERHNAILIFLHGVSQMFCSNPAADTVSVTATTDMKSNGALFRLLNQQGSSKCLIEIHKNKTYTNIRMKLQRLCSCR